MKYVEIIDSMNKIEAEIKEYSDKIKKLEEEKNSLKSLIEDSLKDAHPLQRYEVSEGWQYAERTNAQEAIRIQGELNGKVVTVKNDQNQIYELRFPNPLRAPVKGAPNGATGEIVRTEKAVVNNDAENPEYEIYLKIRLTEPLKDNDGNVIADEGELLWAVHNMIK